MFSKFSIIKTEDISYLDKFLLDDNGILRPVPKEFLETIPHEHLQLFAVKSGIYQFVTIEVLQWLKGELQGYNAIEICAGYGTIGRCLQIPMIDRKLQDEALKT